MPDIEQIADNYFAARARENDAFIAFCENFDLDPDSTDSIDEFEAYVEEGPEPDWNYEDGDDF